MLLPLTYLSPLETRTPRKLSSNGGYSVISHALGKMLFLSRCSLECHASRLFLAQFKGARVVAQNVGLHTGDFYCTRALFNKEVIGEVLKPHALSSYSPLDYPCAGLPAYGTFPAVPCTNEEEFPNMFMIGET